MANIFDAVKNYFIKRRQAYLHVFNEESVFVQVVLKDLARFCRADQSTFHSDARLHAAQEGRREVWLRIMDHTKMDSEEFLAKYGKGKLND